MSFVWLIPLCRSKRRRDAAVQAAARLWTAGTCPRFSCTPGRAKAAAISLTRPLPLFQKGHHLGGIVTVSLFQLTGVLGRQPFPIAVQHHQNRKPKARGTIVLLHHVRVVP